MRLIVLRAKETMKVKMQVKMKMDSGGSSSWYQGEPGAGQQRFR